MSLGEWDGQGVAHSPTKTVLALISKITVHPKYNKDNLENDVAIVKLSGKVPIASNPNINTACKPKAATPAGKR